ncbi:MAG TPA: PAS domain S-box protein [Bacteroidia bacterium]|nr:PAS domain S-box protein [Bacteroidia bacterium]
MKNKNPIRRNALLIALLYCLFGAAWIALSDSIWIQHTDSSNSHFWYIDVLTAGLFVVFSATLIFVLMYFFNKKYSLTLKSRFRDQQEILEKSEKLFRTVIESTVEIILLIDKDGKVIYVNKAFEKITGYNLVEMKGKPVSTIIHPDHIEEANLNIKKLMDSQGVAMPCTNRVLNRKNGATIWLQGTTINLLDDKDVRAIISNCRDVTEKKLIEQKIAFDHNNLKALINNTDDLMWSVDTNYNLITANKAFDDMILFLTGKLIERGSSALDSAFSEEQLNRFKGFYERAFAGETFMKIEHTRSSEEYWSEISFYPIYNEGVIVGTACFSKNITERKLAEIKLSRYTDELIDIKNKLERSEFRLKQAQAIAHVGSWEVDFSNGMAIWSDESCRIYGLSTDDNRKSYEDWKSFIHPEDLKYVLRIIKKSYDTLNPPYFHHRIIRTDGAIRYIYSKTQFEFNAAGEPIGMYGVAHDVTDHMLAQQEIIQKNNELRNLSNHLQHIREEERASIAREIHDELGQQVTVLKMDIGWVMRKQKNLDEAVGLKLQEMLQFSDVLIKTIRRISADLRPPIIDDIGLVAALEWICADFETKTKIPCNFMSAIKERNFGKDFMITTYRILQESLTNVMRHAEAKSVTVLLAENEKELVLEITDEGKGILVETVNSGKTLGVLGMKERAALFGGNLIITGAANKGTKVKLILPFKNAQVVN